MPIPSQAEYERNELDRALAKIREVEKAPLAERKEAAADFAEAMATRQNTVGERIGWLFNGSYGHGAMQLAQRALASRGNREAQLVQLVGAFEWMTPPRATADAWNKMTAAQKKALDVAVKAEIKAAEEEEK